MKSCKHLIVVKVPSKEFESVANLKEDQNNFPSCERCMTCFHFDPVEVVETSGVKKVLGVCKMFNDVTSSESWCDRWEDK